MMSTKVYYFGKPNARTYYYHNGKVWRCYVSINSAKWFTYDGSQLGAWCKLDCVLKVNNFKEKPSVSN